TALVGSAVRAFEPLPDRPVSAPREHRPARRRSVKESMMPENRWLTWVLALLTAGLGPAAGQEADREEVRYARPAGAKTATECTFRITRQSAGWTVTSRTDRGPVQMEVEARYDAQDRLTAARATLTTRGVARSATVQVKDGKAAVRREGQQPAEFDVPRGTIVTSAPDWSDVFLLCRR